MIRSKRFPIQPHFGARRADGFTVPWEMAEKAYRHYTRLFGKSQTLERLAERGGFSWQEFVLLYCEQNPADSRWDRESFVATQQVVADWTECDHQEEDHDYSQREMPPLRRR